jgi:zinc D-Ala-D-Ala carboxypeptidase
MRRILTIIAVLLLALAAAAVYFVIGQSKTEDAVAADQTRAQQVEVPEAKTDQPTELSKDLYSLTDPTSLWVVANKQRRLQPAEYIPDDLVVPDIPMKAGITSSENRLRKVTADALSKLAAAAKTDGLTLTMQSGYRSYSYQTALYNRYVGEQGQATADTQSARAGHSEHQTGLAVDLGGTTRPACNVEDCYKDTPEGKWIAANAHKYGFIIRYPEGKQSVTGYIYEPWHLRFVGTELAADMHGKRVATMEEYFGLPAAPGYN